MGVVSGDYLVDVMSDGERVTWQVDGGPTRDVMDGEIRIDTSTLDDGEHFVLVKAHKWMVTPAEQRFTITTDNSGPRVSIAERSLSVEQGHTLPVVFRVEDPMTHLRVVVADRERTAFEIAPGVWRALVGVPIRQEPGLLPVTIEVGDALGNQEVYQPEVQVIPVDWPTSGKLPLSKEKSEVDPPAVAQMREERDAVYAALHPEALWDGLFGIPVYKGVHTSAFGTFREYPDGTRSHHDAQDIARRKGVPIYAAANGTVALAKMQEVHGNAVLIAHGQKVVTLYSHLKDLEVEPGQHVLKGDIIGSMGSTGRSTGPHLHWGLVVDEVPVDPMQWVDESFELESFGELRPLTPVDTPR
ncbi:MAG: M23 family metallopeptidase [Myxococcota bacterium]